MKKNENKNEANSKEIIAEIEKRFDRHTNILAEQMRHDVKTVAEGHSIVIKKLEDHDKKFVELDKKIGKVESELHSVKMAVMDTGHRVDRIEKKLDESLGNHEKRITKLEEKVFV